MTRTCRTPKATRRLRRPAARHRPLRPSRPSRWEASLPPPALLERYDQVVPGLARQIAEQVKIEAGHVQEHENNTLKASIRDRTRRQWMAFGGMMAIIGLAAFGLWMDAIWVAGVATSIVVGTASVFVLESLWKRKDRPR